MSQIETDIKDALARLALPDGGDLISRDMIRALSVDDNAVRFVIEAPSPAIAQQMEPLRKAAEAAVAAVAGSRTVNAALTAHGPAPAKPAPGRHLSLVWIAFSRLALAKAVLGNQQSRRTLRLLWPNKAAALVCSTLIYTDRLSHA
jgi:hypothetical protein